MSKTWRESLSRAYHSWVVIDSPLRPGDDKNRIKFRFQCFRLQITDHKKSEEPIRSKFPIAWKEKNNEVSLFVFTSLCCFSSFVSLCTRSRRPQSLHFARFCFVFDVMFSFLCLCIFEFDAFRLAADRLVWLRSWWFWNEENSLRVCLVPDWNLFFFFMFIHDILICFLWELRRGKSKYSLSFSSFFCPFFAMYLNLRVSVFGLLCLIV